MKAAPQRLARVPLHRDKFDAVLFLRAMRSSWQLLQCGTVLGRDGRGEGLAEAQDEDEEALNAVLALLGPFVLPALTQWIRERV